MIRNNDIPLVSICIPAYNYGRYLPAAIESVLAQTYRDFELVIVDNASSDDTPEIVKRYASVDKRIRSVRNEVTIDMADNWNRCLEAAAGTYVKILCADDLLEPGCIEKSVRILLDNPHVSLVSCARLSIDESAKPLGVVSYARRSLIVPGVEVIRKCFFTRNLIGEPTAVLFRKNEAKRGFNPQYKQLTDLEMWFHLLEVGDFAFIFEGLCKFRVHQEQMSKFNMRSLAFIDDENLLYRDYIAKEYIGCSFVNRQRWKFKICLTIWSHKFIGLDIKIIRDRIRLYMPLFLFYPLVYLKLAIGKAAQLVKTLSDGELSI